MLFRDGSLEVVTLATSLFLRKVKVKTQWWAWEGKGREGWSTLPGSGEGQGSSPRLEASAVPSSICTHNSCPSPPPCTLIPQEPHGEWPVEGQNPRIQDPGFSASFHDLFTPWKADVFTRACRLIPDPMRKNTILFYIFVKKNQNEYAQIWVILSLVYIVRSVLL